MDYLIVGLGNPGTAYDETRHNMGFLAVEKFAEEQRLAFRGENFLGKLAQKSFGGNKVFLLLPLTYMNSSGEAVRLCAEYFRIAPENILVVCDDIYIPFGTLRLRANGSAGGHNGLKSIEAHLNTTNYQRLRIGIGQKNDGEELADYVLGRFTPEEKKELPQIMEKATQTLSQWLGLTEI